MLFTCAHCAQQMQIDDCSVGQIVVCPHCRRQIVVGNFPPPLPPDPLGFLADPYSPPPVSHRPINPPKSQITTVVPQSGPGIASFVLFCLAAFFLMIGALSVVAEIAKDGTRLLSSVRTLSTILILALPFSVIGAALGIVGRLQSDRKQVLVLVGLWGNAAIVISFLVLFIMAIFHQAGQ